MKGMPSEWLWSDREASARHQRWQDNIYSLFMFSNLSNGESSCSAVLSCIYLILHIKLILSSFCDDSLRRRVALVSKIRLNCIMLFFLCWCSYKLAFVYLLIICSYIIVQFDWSYSGPAMYICTVYYRLLYDSIIAIDLNWFIWLLKS